MGNLAACVNKLAELWAKRLKPQEESKKEQRKERENLLKFRREKTERYKQHELQVAKMYMQMLGMPQSSFVQQTPINFGQFQGMSNQQKIAFPVTSTVVTTSVQPSNNSSKQETSSFNSWDPYAVIH